MAGRQRGAQEFPAAVRQNVCNVAVVCHSATAITACDRG